MNGIGNQSKLSIISLPAACNTFVCTLYTLYIATWLKSELIFFNDMHWQIWRHNKLVWRATARPSSSSLHKGGGSSKGHTFGNAIAKAI